MKKQHGFTLIEIMIAGIIGIFIITGLLNFFMATNRSITLSDSLAKNQEVGRFTMEYLTKFVRRAGYSEMFETFTPPIYIAFDSTNIGPAITCDPADDIKQESACAANDLPDSAQPTTIADPASVSGDRLSIPYTVSRDDVNTITCTGAAVTGTTLAPRYLVDVFWVSSDEDSLRELRCNTFDRTSKDWLSGDAAGVAIINNVEQMEYLVGINEDPDARSATKYVNINKFNTTPTLSVLNIRSIRIAILTSSRDDLEPNALQSNRTKREYILLDAETTKFNDSSLRNIFMTTIEFPNMITTAGT